MIVIYLPQTEVLGAPGRLHMLHTDMDPLLDDLVAHLLVDLDVDGMLGGIPNVAGAVMVELVGACPCGQRCSP